MFPATLETDRLEFERLSAETIDPLALYEHTSRQNSTIEAETEYLPWTPTESVGEAADRLEAFDRQWDERERADWLLRPKADEDGAGEIAGTATLVLHWDRELALPGIWLRKPFWGRGYSGERADALLEVAFDRLDLSLVAIPVHGENERSYRAVRKYVERHGGRYEGLLRNHAAREEGPIDHHRFSISRQEYERSGGS
ncbi:GNAT family N-acetyltransferase [Halobacteria archaeon AArc-m2/3/4]|uniref:GNAT family N-acetyltransferase n=1 Tax=Natronoglomus mannanivorans TaxID=2979990 RepID=A0AAP2YZG7_9EURY|nr:GNAT family N-acetyltransferase [Halobacteria archaeon AArc-xg1-1]MCU4974603.1 GNAT family N-acetyltransferase [Halobacteria archaeon AArc-m2/3/4]